MIGIVVVSHSRALGTAVAELASEMVPAEARPSVRVAAGLDDTTFGTDAAAIADAITEVDSPDGVLVLVDLGSAVLSSQMALEFIDPDLAERVRVSPAPLVEGLVAALVTASTGASLAEVAYEAGQGLVGKQEQLTDDDPAGQGSVEAEPGLGAGNSGTVPEAISFTWTIRNAHGLHARPAAALVAGLRGVDAQVLVSNATSGKGPVSAASLTSIQTLGLRQGDQLSALISGPQADSARARLAELADSDFGERDEPAQTPPAAGPNLSRHVSEPRPGQTGRQIAIGAARQITIDPDTSAYRPAGPDTESTRLDQAVSAVSELLNGLSAPSVPPGAAPDGPDKAIYTVQQLILTDEGTQTELRRAIAQGASAVEAVRRHFTAAAAELAGLDDPYLRARAEDQRGVMRMLLRSLTGQAITPGAASGILIFDELDPVTAGCLDPERCHGVITVHGGATGHGAIMAQARGFALVTGHGEAAGITDGTAVAIDPVNNQLWIDPDLDLVAELRQRQAQRTAESAEASRLAGKPALTRSGKQILVEANLASLADAVAAQQAGAEGSGLVRTEVLFGACDHCPSAEEQAAVFIQIGQALSGAITIRTWDPGGDKPLAFLPQDAEANPMLGERGVRAMRRLPDLFDEQLAAVLLAGRQIPVRVMFPMIALPEEMVWARSRLTAVQARVGGQAPVGMMVETPAAALRAGDFADLADFISIGTNDLTQYTMAVDRGNARVSGIAQGENAAVWDLIGSAGQAFAGRPVAVCGDLASNPRAVPRLIHLGVTELSVRPPLVGTIKQAVRSSA